MPAPPRSVVAAAASTVSVEAKSIPPFAAEAVSAVAKAAPSGETFSEKSSPPRRPSRARAEYPVWKFRAASREAACLLTVSRRLKK